MKNTYRARRKLINRYMRHLLAWNAYYRPERKNNRHELKLWTALHRALSLTLPPGLIGIVRSVDLPQL